MKTLLLFLISFLVPLYLFMVLPPVWNHSDSLDFLVAPLGEVNLLHYPPVYKFFLEFMERLSSFVPPLFSEVPFEQQILLTVFLQHVLLASSLVFFARSASSSWGRQIAALAPLVSFGALFVYNHGIVSESLWVSFLIIQAASAYKIFNSSGNKLLNYFIYGAAFILNILTRHAGIVFAVFLPSLFLCSWVIKKSRASLEALVLSIVVALAAYGAAGGIHHLILDHYHIPERSTFNHFTSLRIHKIPWFELTQIERDEFVRQLQNRTDDPLVRESIPFIFYNREQPWAGSWYALRGFLNEKTGHSYPSRILNVKTDEVYNKIIWLYYTSGSPFILHEWKKDFLNYLEGTPFDISRFILNQSIQTLDFYPRIPDVVKKFEGVSLIDRSKKTDYESFSHNAYLKFFSVSFLFFWFFILALLLVLLWRKNMAASGGVFAAASLFCSFVSMVLLALVTEYLARYALGNFLFLFMSLGILAASWQRGGDRF